MSRNDPRNDKSMDTFSNALYGNPVGTSQNNCYAYAINHYVNSGDTKLQPGMLAGMMTSVELSSCTDLVQRVKADAKAMGWNLSVVSKDATCPRGSIKFASVIAPHDDFHFYKFHKHVLYKVKTPRTVSDLAREFGVSTSDIHVPGMSLSGADGQVRLGDVVLVRNAKVWSHKQGFSPDGPILKDSRGRVIKDPVLACRDYGRGLNYKTTCTTFCLQK